ncbi:hypothetical protein LXL04_034663 [Taraxacum kok-saghyz]
MCRPSFRLTERPAFSFRKDIQLLFKFDGIIGDKKSKLTSNFFSNGRRYQKGPNQPKNQGYKSKTAHPNKHLDSIELRINAGGEHERNIQKPTKGKEVHQP